MHIVEVVARTVNADVALVERIVNSYAEVALMSALLQGPTPTVLGTLSASTDGLSISAQNPRLLHVMQDPGDPARLVNRVVAAVRESQ